MSLLLNNDAVELETVIPFETYLHRVYRPDCDYIDGEVRERNAGYWPHSEMMVIIGAKLREFAKATNTVALMSVRVRVSEDCVLVPDLCLAHRTRPREDVIVTPPLLCVEVLAAEDTLVNTRDRVNRFLAMGVENVWIVDQWGNFGYVVSQAGLLTPEGGLFNIAGTSIQFVLADLFTELNDG